MAGSDRKRITVVVADDHPLYRDGVVRGLAASGQIEVVAEAADGRAALAAIQEHSPDVALLDYKLPGLDGVAITNAVVREQLPTRVLLLSAFTDSGVVYKALETGAAGFISKEARREEIVDGVLAAARGGERRPARDCHPGSCPRSGCASRTGAPALTAREQETSISIAAGKSLPADRDGAPPRADHGEDPRAAPLREARRLGPGGRGGERHAARLDRVGGEEARSSPAHVGDATAEVRTNRRLAAAAGDLADRPGPGPRPPEPPGDGLPRRARALLGVERGRSRLGVPPTGDTGACARDDRRGHRGDQRARSPLRRRLLERAAGVLPRPRRGGVPLSPRLHERSRRGDDDRLRRPGGRPPGGASTRGCPLHPDAGRVSRLGRRRLRLPLTDARAADVSRRAPCGDAIAAAQRRARGGAARAQGRWRTHCTTTRSRTSFPSVTCSRRSASTSPTRKSRRADETLVETVAQLRTRSSTYIRTSSTRPGSSPRFDRSPGGRRPGAPAADPRPPLPAQAPPGAAGLLGGARADLERRRARAGDGAQPRLVDEAGELVLVVEDDGGGIPAGRLSESLREGHVGLPAQQHRIEAAGGRPRSRRPRGRERASRSGCPAPAGSRTPPPRLQLGSDRPTGDVVLLRSGSSVGPKILRPEDSRATRCRLR